MTAGPKQRRISLSPARVAVACGVAAALFCAASARAAAQTALLGRPADVAATMANSPKLYNGAYTSSGVARMCGETDPLQSFTGERAFIVEFPLDYNNGSVIDLRFRSKTLVGSVRQAAGFFVSLTVRAANGGRPPAFVVDTERPAPGNSGTATLSVKDGEASLRVQASDALGQTLDMTVTCGASRPS